MTLTHRKEAQHPRGKEGVKCQHLSNTCSFDWNGENLGWFNAIFNVLRLQGSKKKRYTWKICSYVAWITWMFKIWAHFPKGSESNKKIHSTASCTDQCLKKLFLVPLATATRGSNLFVDKLALQSKTRARGRLTLSLYMKPEVPVNGSKALCFVAAHQEHDKETAYNNLLLICERMGSKSLWLALGQVGGRQPQKLGWEAPHHSFRHPHSLPLMQTASGWLHGWVSSVGRGRVYDTPLYSCSDSKCSLAADFRNISSWEIVVLLHHRSLAFKLVRRNNRLPPIWQDCYPCCYFHCYPYCLLPLISASCLVVPVSTYSSLHA